MIARRTTLQKKNRIFQRMAREGLTVMEEEEEEAIFRPLEQNRHVQVAVQEHCGELDAVDGGMVGSSARFETLVMIETWQEQLIHESTMEHSERNTLQPLRGQAQPSPAKQQQLARE